MGLSLVVIAPGNAVRQSYFPPPSLEGLLSALSLTGSFLMQGVGPLLALAALAGMVALNQDRQTKTRRYGLWLPLLVWLGGALLAMAVSGYFLSGPLIARAWAIPQYAGVLSAATAGYTVGLALRDNRMALVRGRWAVVPILIIALSAAGRLNGAYQQMATYAARYDSGHLLDHEEAWIVDCARDYYVSTGK